MRSKAHIGGHPLHPILIGFPIAFFTGTFLSHLAGWWLEKDDLLRTAYYLNAGGILFGVLAAIPGLIDLVNTVPPRSSGKQRGIKHGLLNSLMLLLFILAFFLRRNPDTSHIVLLAIEVTALVIMSIAGWLGGTLVYRNQIGVDHRYANAGKWMEAHFDAESGEVAVAETGELKTNAMKLLHFPHLRLVLGRTENAYVVFDDHCPHRGGSLAGGSLACGTVQCPWHGSQFDVSTGHLKEGPANTGIKTYPVTERDGKIFVRLS